MGISPILAPDERRSLQTFEKKCQRREDCEPPLGCMPLEFGGEQYCLDSNCLTDLQCRDGFTCRTIRPVGGGLLLRRCVPAGKLQEGAPCITSSTDASLVCEQGLLCNGFCGRPCQEEDSSCPEGFSCRRGANGTSCLPACDGRTCSKGKHCIHFQAGVSACMTLRGENCQEAACLEGQQCKVRVAPGEEGQAFMECITPCSPGASACPEGQVCARGACRQPCSADAGHLCASHQRCAPDTPKGPWVCKPRL